MSIQVAAINLGSAVVGTAGSIQFGQALPPPTLSQQMQHANVTGSNLFVWNESGCGLTCLWPTTGETFTIPAGQWRLLYVPPGETQLHWVVTYIIPNAPVSLLLADLYRAGEPLDPIGVLGNSPLGVTGTVSTSSSTLVYNVTDPTYGAKGNGSTDDTAAIQSAISAAQAAGGGIVFFPVGTYKITSTLIVSSDNIELVGAGHGAILSWAGAINSIMVQIQGPGGAANFRRGIRIAYIFLLGNSIAGVTAIDAVSTYSMLIDHVRIRFCNGTGIKLDGINTAFGAYNIIRGCHITDSTGTGIDMNFSEWNIIESSLFAFWNNAGAGIAVRLPNLNCQVVACQFDHNDISIDLEFAGKNVVTANQFDRGATNYIKMRGCDDCTITSNFFAANNLTTGVDMIAITDAGTHRNVIANNVCEPTGGWTNFVHETVAVTAPGNSVQGNSPSGYGIVLTAGVSYAFANSSSVLSSDAAGNLTAQTLSAVGNGHINNGNQILQILSAGGGAAGVTLWVGTTDPGVAAGEGDVWLPI